MPSAARQAWHKSGWRAVATYRAGACLLRLLDEICSPARCSCPAAGSLVVVNGSAGSPCAGRRACPIWGAATSAANGLGAAQTHEAPIAEGWLVVLSRHVHAHSSFTTCAATQASPQLLKARTAWAYVDPPRGGGPWGGGSPGGDDLCPAEFPPMMPDTIAAAHVALCIIQPPQRVGGERYRQWI